MWVQEDLDKKIFVRLIRVGFVSMMLVVMLLYVWSINQDASGMEVGFATKWYIPVLTSLGLSGIFLALDVLIPRKKISIISGIVFGLIAGLITAWVFSQVIDLIVETWDLGEAEAFVSAIKVLMGVSLAYLGITTVVQTQDDFRLVIPYVEFAKQMRGPMPLLLDTSALIDARIADIAASGLLQQTVVIPEFVIEELQVLADARDRMKRNKGHRGLDIVTKLQRMNGVDVVIDSSPVSKKAVDLALIELATRMPAMLVTLDMALSRIAAIQNIPTLNINDLANALKPVVIPGKMIRVELIKPGEQHGQGVGYLADGTMVVAEDGYPYIGQTRDLVITSSMQTAAGRLLFARVDMAEMDDDAREHALQESQNQHHRRSSDSHDRSDQKVEVDVKPASISGPRVVADPGVSHERSVGNGNGNDGERDSRSMNEPKGGGSPNAKGTPRNPRRG